MPDQQAQSLIGLIEGQFHEPEADDGCAMDAIEIIVVGLVLRWSISRKWCEAKG